MLVVTDAAEDLDAPVSATCAANYIYIYIYITFRSWHTVRAYPFIIWDKWGSNSTKFLSTLTCTSLISVFIVIIVNTLCFPTLDSSLLRNDRYYTFEAADYAYTYSIHTYTRTSLLQDRNLELKDLQSRRQTREFEVGSVESVLF